MSASEKLVRYKQRPLTQEERDHLEAVAKLPDETIDFSDIPEADEQFFAHAVRGPLFRPIKKQTTLRLDADLIDWFKRHSGEGDSPRGYQTRINRALREYVSAQQEKAAKKAR